MDNQGYTVKQDIEAFDRLSFARMRYQIDVTPNFIGVGSGRCGTTSLYKYLDSHAEAYVSPVKEINYFGFRQSEITRLGLSFDDYKIYFSGASNQSAIGEISPIYLTIPGCAGYISAQLPKAKIIAQVREPISRALSQYKHHLARHGDTDPDHYFQLYFSGNGSKKWDWVGAENCIRQSLYSKSLEEFIRLFGRQNVLVLFYDDINGYEDYWLKVTRFLGIKEMPYLGGKMNASRGSHSISQKTKELMQKIFLPDIERLEKITGRDLSSWK